MLPLRITVYRLSSSSVCAAKVFAKEVHEIYFNAPGLGAEGAAVARAKTNAKRMQLGQEPLPLPVGCTATRTMSVSVCVSVAAAAKRNTLWLKSKKRINKSKLYLQLYMQHTRSGNLFYFAKAKGCKKQSKPKPKPSYLFSKKLTLTSLLLFDKGMRFQSAACHAHCLPHLHATWRRV